MTTRRATVGWSVMGSSLEVALLSGVGYEPTGGEGGCG
jgi:hypothetical protein